MQTEEPPQFRFSKEVAVIVLITLVALLVPLGGIALMVRNLASHPKPAQEIPVNATAPLRHALEDIAQKNLAPDSLGGPSIVHLEVADPVQEEARVKKLAQSVGGSILPTSTGTDGAHFLAQLPAGTSGTFVALCEGQVTPPAEIAKGAGSSDLVEVIIAKKAP